MGPTDLKKNEFDENEEIMKKRDHKKKKSFFTKKKESSYAELLVKSEACFAMKDKSSIRKVTDIMAALE